MTISEYRDKCKAIIGRIPRDVQVITVLILASFFSFGLGYLVGRDTAKTADFSLIDTGSVPIPVAAVLKVGKVVASKRGTKYYLPRCAGAARTSDANKVWFESIEAARRAGYSPAANCPGM